MDVFIVRQPVFNELMEIIGYVLLADNEGEGKSSSDEVTATVIINGSLMMGLEVLTEHKKAFISFTGKLILDEMATLLDPDEYVMDIADECCSKGMMDAVKSLKGKGYTISINGDNDVSAIESMLKYIDMVRINFSILDGDRIEKIAGYFSRRRIEMMATHVDTREDFDYARSLGYQYFVGNFFKKPKKFKAKDIKVFKNTYLTLMKELYHPSPEFNKISEAVEHDLSLTYKIMKLVNSSAYSGSSKITDIHQALVRIGMKDLYKWFGLIVLRELSEDQPDVYAWTSIIRAKVLENIAEEVGLESIKQELFITGMFSMIDIILERPMEEILKELPLADDVMDALMGKDNVLGKGLRILDAYEQGNWHLVLSVKGFGNKSLEKIVPHSYFEAVEWAQEVLG